MNNILEWQRSKDDLCKLLSIQDMKIRLDILTYEYQNIWILYQIINSLEANANQGFETQFRFVNEQRQ